LILVGLRLTVPKATPVPDRFTDPFTVPCMVKTAVRAPVADGVNVSSTVQVLVGRIVAPFAQVPEPAFAKLVAFVPLITKYGVDRTSFAVPTFWTVTVIGEGLVAPIGRVPNGTGDGENDSAGRATAVPVPVSPTLLGLLAALVVNVKLATFAPVLVGENTTLRLQEEDAASEPPQVLPLVLN
jgi:hypothetical protein